MSEVLDKFIEDFEEKINVSSKNYKELQDLSKKMINQLKKEKEYNDKIVDTFKKFQVIDSDIVKLNVGGTLFSTLKSTLTKKIKNPETEDYYKPNVLEGLVNGYIEPKFDENKSIFIDRNPKYFGYILDYLRMANTESEFELPDNVDTKDLKKEVQYYNIEGLSELLKPLVKLDSVILTPKQKVELMKLCEFQANSSWNLRYRATRDGFGANIFHSKCDGAQKTLTILKSQNGYIFGGYTNVAWDQSMSYKSNCGAFLFSLVNKDNVPVKVKGYGTNEIYCHSSYGPTFGSGHDLHICSNSNTNNGSYSNLGSVFAYSTNPSILAGSYNFLVSEIEVFNL